MIGFGFNDLRLSIIWKPLRFLLLSKEGKRPGDFFPIGGNFDQSRTDVMIKKIFLPKNSAKNWRF
jgi:hypothetical protein